jgi:Tol biopolymer transport system component
VAPPTPPETRVEVTAPATDQPTNFAVSADGHQLVFVASGDGTSRLWLRSLTTTGAQPLAGTEGARYPFWSPDGRSIAFFAENALKRLDLGGTPQMLAPASPGGGGTWSADGVILFAPAAGKPLMRVSATGGPITAVTTLLPQQVAHSAPFFLPNGRQFLFYAPGAPSAATTGIYLAALDGTAATRLTPDASAGVFLPTGWLLWVRAGTLVAQRLDATNRMLTGESVTVADRVAVDVIGRIAVSVAPTGLIAYRTAASNARQLMWVDRAGTARGAVGDPDATFRDPRVSPDGQRVAVARALLGNVDLWLLDRANRISRVTSDAAMDAFPIWSPDGHRIMFSSNRGGQLDLYQKLTNVAGPEEPLLVSEQAKAASSWSADGRFVLFNSVDPSTVTDLWILQMDGNRTASVFLKTPFREAYGVFSPDGKWVAYHSNETGRPEIYVRPFVAPGQAATPADANGGQPVSAAGGVYAAWRSDGKELYYLNPAGAMVAAPITVIGRTLSAGTPVILFPTRIVGGGQDLTQPRQYDIAPDGRFLINTVMDGAPEPITLIQNWHPDAKK